MQVSNSISVLVVDKHDSILEGIAFVLRQNFPDIKISLATSPKNALDIIKKQEINIAIIAISFKGHENIDSISLCKSIKSDFSHIKIICHSAYYSYINIRQISRIGVHAIIEKYDGTAAIIKAIHEIINGHRYYSNKILENFPNISEETDKYTKMEARLSPRQMQIVELIAQAKTNKEISEILSISTKTIESHINNIADTLGLQKANKLKILYKLGRIV